MTRDFLRLRRKHFGPMVPYDSAYRTKAALSLATSDPWIGVTTQYTDFGHDHGRDPQSTKFAPCVARGRHNSRNARKRRATRH